VGFWGLNGDFLFFWVNSAEIFGLGWDFWSFGACFHLKLRRDRQSLFVNHGFHGLRGLGKQGSKDKNRFSLQRDLRLLILYGGINQLTYVRGSEGGNGNIKKGAE